MDVIEKTVLPPGLYVVATPLGHARDITLRALDVLAAADVVLCEDTRTTGKLTARYRIDTQRIAYHEHNAAAMRPKILARLAAGEAVALVSDAGTPLISDPGMPLVRAARAAGHEVFAVPGASAPIAALSVAGLASDRFTFAGFLPPKQAARRRALAALSAQDGTVILFESASGCPPFWPTLRRNWPTGRSVWRASRRKKFEELRHGSAAELAAHFAAVPPRGEIVVLIAPGAAAEAGPEEIDAQLRAALQQMSRRDAVQAVTQATGLPRRQIYDRALALPDDGADGVSQTDTKNTKNTTNHVAAPPDPSES